MLLARERNIRELVQVNRLDPASAENIAVPSKPAIAKNTGMSLAHVQNVHRVMRETAITMQTT